MKAETEKQRSPSRQRRFDKRQAELHGKQVLYGLEKKSGNSSFRKRERQRRQARSLLFQENAQRLMKELGFKVEEPPVCNEADSVKNAESL